MRLLLIALIQRAWDVFVASTPLFACLLTGSVCWEPLRRRLAMAGSGSLPAVIAMGGLALQAITWLGALFSVPLTWIIQWAVLVAGSLAAAFLLYSPPSVRVRYPVFSSLVARAAGIGGLALGFVFAGSTIPASIPSDAIAYHLPVSAWYGQGGALPALVNHTWNAQWPLASSLWSSFVTGHLPLFDRLVAWSAQTVAFGVWTAATVFAVVATLLGRIRAAWIVGGSIALSLVVGAYSGYQQRIGFIDYRLGLFAAALIGTLLPVRLSFRTLPLAIALASTVAEFRPQGLIYAVAILLCWALLSWSEGSVSKSADPNGRTGRSEGVPILLVGYGLAIALFSKWWVLNWLRWGTPAPPIFGRLFKLRQTEQYADELFRYLWVRDLRDGLRLVFFGTRDTWLITVLMWTLILLAIGSLFVRWRKLREDAGGSPSIPRRLLRSVAFLLPVAAIAYIAIEVPTEASRMIAGMIPALLLISLYGIWSSFGKAVPALLGAFSILFLALSVVSAPTLGERPHAARAYPTPSTTYFSQIEQQLGELRGEHPLLFDVYVAFLPPGVRQMGVTYGPWASFPEKPLRSIDTWMDWLRKNGVGAVVVQQGKTLESTWAWTQARTETPDFTILDRWIESCPGKRLVGQWVACPVPTP